MSNEPKTIMINKFTLLAIHGDYAMWVLADSMIIGLNSDKPDVYEWSLNSLKKFGELRKKQEEDGYLKKHYADINEFLKQFSDSDKK